MQNLYHVFFVVSPFGIQKKKKEKGIKAGLHRYANTNAACGKDAYIHVGKFVNCSVFAEAAN